LSSSSAPNARSGSRPGTGPGTHPGSETGPRLACDELARALGARALPPHRWADGRSASAAELRVRFLASALPGGARAALAASGALALDESGPLAVLTGPRAALAAVAAGEPALERLLVAHDLACLPPPAPRLMGIVNVTPDSFSDGGRYLDPERAIEHGRALAAAGAALVDVGGESTRPGARAVGEAEELERVLPVVGALAAELDVPVSIDTRKASVARAALQAGASVVNDVGAGADPGMLEAVAEHGAGVVLMHMRGEPATMQEAPRYDDVVGEVLTFLRSRVDACLKAGIDVPKIVVDPGIGFGKRLGDNLTLLRAVPEFRSLGLPVLLGVSRKSFLSALSGAPWEEEKVVETSAALAVGAFLGAAWLRVHDVERMGAALRVAGALAAKPGGLAGDRTG